MALPFGLQLAILDTENATFAPEEAATIVQIAVDIGGIDAA